MTTIQRPITVCDCCGLQVDPLTTEDCPRCHYPVRPDREERFLQSAIADLQRVAAHSGADLRVTDLINRYQIRLSRFKKPGKRRQRLAEPIVRSNGNFAVNTGIILARPAGRKNQRTNSKSLNVIVSLLQCN